MKEFLFYIRKVADSRDTLSQEKHKDFLLACEKYIAKLKSEGRLLAAQPIERTGYILSYQGKQWKQVPYNENPEVIGGYYHLRAKDLEEAVEIAKSNPEFAYNAEARIEVRPVKMKEQVTGFVYPTE